jgi:hypothetical protein
MYRKLDELSGFVKNRHCIRFGLRKLIGKKQRSGINTAKNRKRNQKSSFSAPKSQNLRQGRELTANPGNWELTRALTVAYDDICANLKQEQGNVQGIVVMICDYGRLPDLESRGTLS